MADQYGIGDHDDSGDGVDRGLDLLVLPGGDREPHVELGRGGDHRLGVERTVGADGQLPGGAGAADPGDRLGQERLGAAGGAGVAAPQPRHQHLPGLRAGRQLRVVAADLGVAERGALLRAAGDLDDGGVDVDRQRRRQVGRAGAGGPGPGQQLPADRVELPDVGPLVRAQPRPDRRRRPRGVEQPGCAAGAQHRGVVDAVAADQHRPDHRQRLRPAVRAVLGERQPLVDQPGQVRAAAPGPPPAAARRSARDCSRRTSW